jgi:hypothetical protein
VIVENPPRPPFRCNAATPIDRLTMTYDGDTPVDRIAVYRKKYNSKKPNKGYMYTIEGPIVPGQAVTAFGYVTAQAKSVVDWVVFFNDRTSAVSRFRLDCKDEDMNGPEDCGLPQGDWKKGWKTRGFDGWRLQGMQGNGLALDCGP